MTKLATTVALVCAWLVPWAAATAAEEDFHRGIAALASAESYDDKEAAAATISASGYPRAEAVLTALLEGELYTTRAGGRLVTAADADGGYAIRDAVTDEDLGTVGRRDVSRVTVNNQLRGTLRSMMASLKLRHEDPAERSAAIREVGESEDLAMIETLEQLLTTEEHGGVRTAIAMAIATLNLDSTDPATRLAAIEGVSTNVSGHVRTKLTAIAADAALDDATRAAAQRSLNSIERRIGVLRARADRLLRPEPGLDSRARGDRLVRDVRHHGRHQHGARRAHDARRVHDLRRADADAERHRRVAVRRDARGVPDRGARRHRDRARHRAHAVRAAARNAAGDVRREPRAAADRAQHLLAAEPLGHHAGLAVGLGRDRGGPRRSR